ncbi:MAG: magnesium/cobalt transporter CorA [Chloroflexi bacterium]|nr:magnesium/cobalt transporter CorA [Chloroflexota bacterium]
MHILIEKKDKKIIESTRLDDVVVALNEPEFLVWVDLDDESIEESRHILADIFHFHPLSIDDALVEEHVPKIDDWGDYLYMAMVAVNPMEPLEDIDKSIELDIFIGRNYLVTYHSEVIQSVNLVWRNTLRDERKLQQGSNFLAYQIIDEMANEYMTMIDHLDMKVEEIEDKVVEKPDRRLLEDIFAIKRSLLNLRRIVSPQREVLNKLSRGDFSLIDQRERMYYRDVYDHLVRVQEITENLRDLVSGALDTYLSVVNNHLNDIMKTLTIITTLFMPLSFLTGFFGMNFFAASNQLDFWTNPTAFAITMAIMVGLPISMFLWMRRRAWM